MAKATARKKSLIAAVRRNEEARGREEGRENPTRTGPCGGGIKLEVDQVQRYFLEEVPVYSYGVIISYTCNLA